MSKVDFTDWVELVSRPVAVPSEEDWAAIEGSTGSLPSDFKHFATEYGAGVLDTYLNISTPSHLLKPEHMIQSLINTCSGLVVAQRRFKFSDPRLFDLDFLPFSYAEGGEILGWRRRPLPSDWSTVIFAPREAKLEEFDFGFSKLLHGLLDGSTTSYIMGNDFPSSESRKRHRYTYRPAGAWMPWATGTARRSTAP